MIFMMLMIFAANHNGSDDIYEDMCLWWRNKHVAKLQMHLCEQTIAHRHDLQMYKL